MSTSKVLVANYYLQEIYKIPKGLDLEDKTQVIGWGIKWSILEIELVDGTVLEIKPENAVQESHDFKRPSDETIENAEDYDLFDEEEEDNCIGCGPVKVSDIVLNFDGVASCGECLMNTETVVIGIVCRKCNNVLPPHTMAEHLDVTNKILECPHVRECDDDEECVCLHGKRWIDGECGKCKWLESQGL